MMRVIFVLVAVLAFSTALPTTSKYRVYKNPRSKVALEGGTVPVHVTTVETGGDVAAVLTRVDPTVAPVSPIAVTPAVPTAVVPEEVVEVTTGKPKTGNTPVGEPTKVPSVPAPSPFPPAVVVPETGSVIPQTESSKVVGPPAVENSPVPSTVTVVPPLVDSKDKVNTTQISEEDDSSSEEDEEEDEEGRKLLSRRNPKSARFPFSTNALSKRVSPKNPPLKYDLVINGFVTENGEVLVPFDTYQKYFQDAGAKQLPSIYAITRDETQSGPSTTAVVSEETEADKSSEEVKGQATALKSKPETESSGSSEEGQEANPSLTADTSEEKEATTLAEREKPANTNEIAQPLISETPPRFRPPLQVLPARLPTGEDDEEDAGRYLDQLDFLPEPDYEDDFEFHDDLEHFGEMN